MIIAMLRPLFLACLVIAVSAKFEYDYDVAKTLSYFGNLAKNSDFLKYELVNPDAQVTFKKFTSETQKGVVFNVDANGPTKTGSSSECNGRPGMMVTLHDKKGKKVVCYSSMRFDIDENTDEKPYMTIVAQFEDAIFKRSLEIRFSVFKPQTVQPKVEIEESEKPFELATPIPIDAFSSGAEEFKGDLSWLKPLLDDARFDGYSVSIHEFSEWYNTRPSVLQKKAFNKILKLNWFSIPIENSSES